MADAETFATIEDYSARYGYPSDEARCAVLLADASALLLTAYERHYRASYVEGDHAAFDRNACAVACAIVHRGLDGSGIDGASQQSQTAGSYQMSVTWANPTGDLWLGRSDLKRLGLTGSRVWSIVPMVGDDHESA